MHHPLVESLLALDRLTATRLLVDHAREHGPLATVDHLVSPALDTIGQAWDRGDTSLAQVYMAARLCEEVVTPILPDEGHRSADQPRIAIAVLDDAHALGKRIVKSVLHASGYVVRDYGITVPADVLATQAANDGIDVLLVSTLMLRAALQVRPLVDRLRALGFGGRVVVGGAPFRMDDALWRDVGADAFGRTAADALAVLKGGAR